MGLRDSLVLESNHLEFIISLPIGLTVCHVFANMNNIHVVSKGQRKLGLGTAITSVTMTVFYVLLYFIWKEIFPGIEVSPAIPALIFITAAVRIVLCLFPQNDWFSGKENLRWSLYRNIPFAITGILVIALFAISGNMGGYGLWRMCIAIALSFSFYLPVTLFAKRKPAVGALMLPKTVMYNW